ncbi:MAG: hypothetical protein ACETV0_08365 [Nitrososphaeria archaeon]
MEYWVFKCDECGAIMLADGGAFLAHRKTKHNRRGYGRSKAVAIIAGREKKYQFRDVPQKKRDEWIKANGVLKPLGTDRSVQPYGKRKATQERKHEYVYVIT